MGAAAAASAAAVGQMSGLSSSADKAASAVHVATAAAAMQFPLTQRRKRRVLFTQAQVNSLRTITVNTIQYHYISCDIFSQIVK